MAAFCVIELDGWETWWQDTRGGSIHTYVSIVLFFLSAVLAHPIARSVFFLLRKFTPKKWLWPDDAKALMMWQTSLLCRAGLLWIALKVSQLSMFLCQWPVWLFGVCFIIWMDAGGNLLRVVIVRKGIEGYSKSEEPGRKTLLHEGTALAKMLLLIFVVYTYYLANFISDDNYVRLVLSTGFFLAIALSMLPLLRNVMGAHYMFLSNMLHLDTHIDVQGKSKGSVSDAPLGFIVLDTDDNTKTYIPAGGTVTSTTAVYHSHFWPLRLDIRLPPQTPAPQVREFLQELDQLLFWDGRFLPRHTSTITMEAPPVRMPTMTPMASPQQHQHQQQLQYLTGGGIGGAASFSFSAVNRSNRSSSAAAPLDDTSRMLFELNLKEENQVVQRARGDESYIALKANERWVVHFRTFIKGRRKPKFRQIRAAYIDAITRLIESQGIGYGGAQLQQQQQQRQQYITTFND